MVIQWKSQEANQFKCLQIAFGEREGYQNILIDGIYSQKTRTEGINNKSNTRCNMVLQMSFSNGNSIKIECEDNCYYYIYSDSCRINL